MTLKQIPLVGGKGPTGDAGPPGPGGKGWGWTYKSGQWYGAVGTREGGGLVSADLITAHYMFIGSNRTFDRMAFTVNQQSPSDTKLAIYADDGEGYPGAKILETASVATNLPQQHEIVINQTLPQGLYWMAYHSRNACNVATYEISTSGPCMGVPGLATHATGGYGSIGGWQLSRAWSLGYPSSFPTDAPARIGAMGRVILRAA